MIWIRPRGRYSQPCQTAQQQPSSADGFPQGSPPFRPRLDGLSPGRYLAFLLVNWMVRAGHTGVKSQGTGVRKGQGWPDQDSTAENDRFLLAAADT